VTTWQRSARCSSGGCIDVSHQDGQVLVRDSKEPDQPPIAIRDHIWHVAVTDPIRDGRLALCVYKVRDNVYEWRGATADGRAQTLTFDQEEWDTFAEAVRSGQWQTVAA
jgi:hypothetical protein